MTLAWTRTAPTGSGYYWALATTDECIGGWPMMVSVSVQDGEVKYCNEIGKVRSLPPQDGELVLLWSDAPAMWPPLPGGPDEVKG